jgi:hypothetical protein
MDELEQSNRKREEDRHTAAVDSAANLFNQLENTKDPIEKENLMKQISGYSVRERFGAMGQMYSTKQVDNNIQMEE